MQDPVDNYWRLRLAELKNRNVVSEGRNQGRLDECGSGSVIYRENDVRLYPEGNPRHVF